MADEKETVQNTEEATVETETTTETETEVVEQEEPATEVVTEDEESSAETVTTEVPEKEKPAVNVDEEVERRVAERLERERQKIVDNVVAKERKRDDSAKRQIKELEHAAGMNYEQLLATVRTNRVQSLMDQGFDEQVAKRMVQTEEENARLKAAEAQRQAEHATFQRKAQYNDAKTAYLNDAKVDPLAKATVKKYAGEIDTFVQDAFDEGRDMPFEVARDYIIGRHALDILKERDRATEARTLANVDKRGKVAPEMATPSGGKADVLPNLTQDQKEMAHAAMPHLSKAEAERKFAARLRDMKNRK